MTPTTFGWGAALVGAGALAGLLYLLQRLRTRFRPVRVPTTMFWQKAVDESQARVLVRRFRHPWAYVLILLLSLSLWFAFSGLQWTTQEESSRRIFVLNGGADADIAGGRAVLLEALGHEPGAEVYVLGEQPRLWLRAGESPGLLPERWAGLRKDPAWADIHSFLARLGHSMAENQRADVFLVGFVETSFELPEGSPLKVHLVGPARGSAAAEQPALEALGWGPSESGPPGTVDVRIQVNAAAARRGLKPVPGRDSSARDLEQVDAALFRLRAVPARGQILPFTLPAAGQDGDLCEASLVLPDWRPLAVALASSLPDDLSFFCESSPFLSLDPQRAQVTLGFESDGTAALLLHDRGMTLTLDVANEGEKAWVRDHVLAGLDLRHWELPGEDEVFAVTTRVSPDGRRRAGLPRALFDPARHFVEHRDFPVLMGRLLFWLGGLWESPPFARSGASLDGDRGLWRSASGEVAARNGRDPVARTAGVYSSERGGRIAVSLLAREAVQLRAGRPAPRTAAPPGKTTTPLILWFGLLALVLLVVEWHLLRTARIP